MTSPTCQDSGPFREWAPLTALLHKIPAKFQNGLFAQDINFTCIDAVTEFIAIGSNHGLIYWFDRKNGEVETLACENANTSITCVKIVSTVDYMVAAGNNQGVVTIFQIPKRLPESLPETLKSKRKKQVERFNIRGLHKESVTAIEWSKNGMKLFSGDKNGLIVLTEMDFYLHLTKSTELLNEKYAVIQLSYQNGLLLISTLFRTIVVNRNQNNQVTQVGQKERKMLGKLGAVFSKNKNHIQEPIIYASRPGLRIWQANKCGTVLKTLILKEAVKLDQSRVELLNPVSNVFKRKSCGDPTFGIILPLSDDLLVTYNEDVVYIINPHMVAITSVVTDLRKVTDLACLEDEIFILEGERNIVRISCYPELTNFNTEQIALTYAVGQHESVERFTPVSEASTTLSWGLDEITSKLKSTPIVPAIPFHKINPRNLIQSANILPPVIVGMDTASIVKAEEAVEVPPIVPLQLDTQLLIANEHSEKENTSANRKDIFKKIGEQDFEEVVFTPQKRDKKLLDSCQVQITNAEPVEINFYVHHDKKELNTCSANSEIIEKSIEDQEKFLFDYLNLDLSNYVDKSKIYSSKSSSSTDHTNDMIHSWSGNSSDDQSVQKQHFIEENLEQNNLETKLINLNEIVENSETKPIEEQISWVDQFDSESKSISEAHFNALSKEFVKSSIYQENDDWTLIG